MASPYALDFNPLLYGIRSAQEYGLQKNRLAQEEERLGFERQLQPIRVQSAQQQLETARAGEARTAQMHPFQLTQAQQQVSAGEDEAAKRKAGIYAGFIDERFTNPEAPTYEKDPAARAANWTKMVNGPLKEMTHFKDPEIGPLLRDPELGPRMVLNIARGYQDPLVRKKLETDIFKDTAHGKLFEAQALAAGNKGTGFDSLKDVLKYEQDLREEFTKQPAVKEYGTVRDAYSKIQGAAEDKSAAGDISMIFAYMKMLDPQSTVREGEFATAQNATGVPGQITNLYNKVMEGLRLNEAQRLDFINQANKVYSVHDRQYGALRGQYEGLARRAGIDPARITLDFGKIDSGQRSPYGTGPSRPQLEGGGVVRPDQPRLGQPQSIRVRSQSGQAVDIPAQAVQFLIQRGDTATIQAFEQKYGVSARQFLEQQVD